ncbi:MAG TPA: hypothetical protein VH540_25070 [Ktedonobacterales bacterium]
MDHPARPGEQAAGHLAEIVLWAIRMSGKKRHQQDKVSDNGHKA